MRAHFFKISGTRCVFFPDTLRYFEINLFTEHILRDILQNVEAEDICNRREISLDELQQLNTLLVGSESINPLEFSDSENKLSRLAINISNTCNLACRYCYAHGGNYFSEKAIMSSHILQSTLDLFFAYFEQIKSIQLFGGEPFLNPRGIETVGKFLENIKEDKRPFITAVTNGTIMSEELLELIQKYNIGVTVSIDGPADINDYLRVYKDGTGTTDLVEKNIRLLAERTNKPIIIEATYTKLHQQKGISFDHLAKYFVDSLGVNNLHIVPVIDDDLCMEDYQPIIQSIEELFKNKKQGYPLPTIASKIIRALKFKKPTSYLCDAGLGTLAVSIEGSVYPCFMLADQKEFYMGQVDDSHLFEREAYLSLNKKMKAFNKFASMPCKECFANTICIGCLGKNQLETRDIHTVSAKSCALEKAVVEHVIVELIRLDKENS